MSQKHALWCIGRRGDSFLGCNCQPKPPAASEALDRREVRIAETLGLLRDERSAHERTRAELAFMTSAYESCEADLAAARARVALLERQRGNLLDTKATLQLQVESAESALASAREIAIKHRRESERYTSLKYRDTVQATGFRELDELLHAPQALLSTPTPAPSEPELPGMCCCTPYGFRAEYHRGQKCYRCGGMIGGNGVAPSEPVAVTEARDVLRDWENYDPDDADCEWQDRRDAWLSAHPKPR